MLESQEKAAWAEEYARIDREYEANTVPTQLGRSTLESAERAWARKGGE